jgi:membrane associated rhomboid family serine protease
MLENRDYMRADYESAPPPRFGAGGGWRYSLTIWLIIANVVIFAGQLLLPLEALFALRANLLWHGAVWQLLTYQFLHGGPMHLLINCLMLYWFGNVIENNFGWRRMLALYLGSGAVGGLVQAAFSTFTGTGMVPVVGASAGVFGLVAAFAILFRNQPITMLVAFVFPVAMKAKYLLLIEVVLSVLGMMAANDNIAHAAHLGGMLVGVAWALSIEGWRPQLPRRQAPPASRFHSLEMAGTAAKQRAGTSARSRPSAEDLPKDEFLAQEVDPILDKISAHGIQSLTEREKRILAAAKRKMDGR